MTNNKADGITFDRQSGISEEEQKEILAKINDITEKRRRSLAAKADAVAAAEVPTDGKGNKIRFAAKKSGNLFPILFNTAAVLALAGGLFLLSSFQGKNDIEYRTGGTKVYNSAERALIEEIRKETSSRLQTKEKEIAVMTSQLEGVDAELRGLNSAGGELTAEQKATEARLKTLHDEYTASLEKLREERSDILEESRVKELLLQTQLDNRMQEFIFTEEQSTAALAKLREELETLSREQSLSATVEAQMGAFFANVYDQVRENRLDDATGTIKSMRDFLNTPAFQALRTIQARKELYTQSVNALEAVVEEARRERAAPAGEASPAGNVTADAGVEKTLADLRERNAELEQIIESVSVQGTGTNRRLAELDRTVQNLEASSKEKDSQISTLTTNLTTQTQNAQNAQQQATAAQTQVTTLTQTVAARDGTINDLRGRLTTRDNAIAVIREIVASGEIADMTVGQLTNSLERIRQTLNQQ
jgi:chromosome segregation ATPase